jgi:hypothetical protein
MSPINTGQPMTIPTMERNTSGIQDPSTATMQNMVNSSGNTAVKSCLSILGFLLVIALFIIFGNTILSYFNLSNVYFFIVTIFVSFVLYLVGIIITQIRIKEPKDLLTIITDRLKG